MLTEVQPTLYNIVVHGKVVLANIPSKALAESSVYSLSIEDRLAASIIPVTLGGQQVLFG